VKDAATVTEYDRDHLALLLGGNALALYGDRLRESLPAYLEKVALTGAAS
jgi:uncharacterized protein